MKHSPATIYLLHVTDADGKTARLQHAGHYIGSCPPTPEGFARRMAEHRAGRGARITSAFLRAGLTWVVARTWEATRGYEFVLKKKGGAARICPICQEEKHGCHETLRVFRDLHNLLAVLASKVTNSPERPTNPYPEFVPNVMDWGGTNVMGARGESR